MRFFHFFQQFSPDHSDLNVLQAQLRSFSRKIQPPHAMRASLRARLLTKIESPRPVALSYAVYGVLKPIVALLQKVSFGVEPSAAFRVKLWDDMCDLLTWQSFRVVPAPRVSVWSVLQPKLATALVLIMVFVGTASFFVEPKIASASRFTYVEKTAGMVTVQRGDVLFANVDRFYLQEGDVVKTGPDGAATIFYMDGSISRLRSSTNLSLVLLYLDPEETAHTQIRVQVLRGRMWSHVAEHSTLDSFFEVFSPLADAIVRTAQEGAFDVHVQDDGHMTVTAANNVVSVLAYNTQATLLEGDTVTVSADSAVGVASSSVSVPLSLDVDGWIAQNQSADADYAESLALYYQKEAEFKAGLLPDNPLYGLKSLSEDAQLLLSFDAVSHIDVQLNLAENRLHEALTLAGKEKDLDALAAIAEYQELMHGVLGDLVALQDSTTLDDATRTELAALEDHVDRLLGSERRALMTMNSKAQVAEITTATSEIQKVLAQIQDAHTAALVHTSSTLFAAKEALENAQYDLAIDYFQQYRNEGLLIGLDISAIDPATRTAAVAEMIARKTEDVWFLLSLEKNENQPAVAAAISATITATVGQTNRIVIALVQSVEDLALSFAVVDVTANDRAAQLELLALLKSDATLPPVVVSRIEGFLRALDGTVQTTVSPFVPVSPSATTQEPVVIQ